MENWLLCSLANPDAAVAGSAAESDDGGEEMAQITSELRSLLDLAPEQLAIIEECSRGCVHEVRDLFAVDDCLRSIHSNEWLLDEGVDGVAGQLTGILNQTQLSKFLLWSDHNAESIERLDYVNVIGGGGGGWPPVYASSRSAVYRIFFFAMGVGREINFFIGRELRLCDFSQAF